MKGTTDPGAKFWVRKLSLKGLFAIGSPNVAKVSDSGSGAVGSVARAFLTALRTSAPRQPHRRPAAAAYGVLEIGFSDIDRFADAGTVQTQAGQDLFSDRTDAGEEAFQGVALDLTGRIPDVFPLHVREPVLAGHPDVLVIGDTEHVSAAERVRGAIRR